MLIYIIIKMLMSIFVLKTKIIKLETLNLIFDITILIIFIDLVFIIDIKQNEQIMFLLKMFIIYSLIFVIYNLSNYILINRVEVELINKFDVNTRERIKKIFMRPVVYKIVYYFIWMLPWNIMYYIYFWWIENSWYLQVWINSTRDIIIWRWFKWDSREYFFIFNEKIKNSYLFLFFHYIYLKLRVSFYRIILGLYYIRKKFLKTTIEEYIRNRIIIFMYLSIYYYYFMLEIKNINNIFFLLSIIVEIMLLLFIGEIFIIFYKNYPEKFMTFVKNYKLGMYMKWIINPIENYTLVNEPYIIKNTIWDKTLSNSVSLNILYNWMIYVNTNSEGYYYYNMKIRTNYLIFRQHNFTNESIIWDILPRTRYVIISLKYNYVENNYSTIPYLKELEENKKLNMLYLNKLKENKNINFEKFTEDMERPKFTIEEKKNLYLSFFEKTYDGNSSLLFLIWVLRNNFAFCTINLKSINFFENEKQLKELDEFLKICMYHLNFRRFFYLECLLLINKNNKNLLSDELLLRICRTKNIYYIRDLESFVLKNIFKDDFNVTNFLKPIPKNYVGIKNYKKMFELMSYMTLFEEEGIIWNDDLQIAMLECSAKYNFNLFRKDMENFLANINNYYYSYWMNEFWEKNIKNCKEVHDDFFMEILLTEYNIEFQKNIINLSSILENEIKKLKIIDYGIFKDKNNDYLLKKIKILNYILSKISKNDYKYNDITKIENMTEEEQKEIIKKYK